MNQDNKIVNLVNLFHKYLEHNPDAEIEDFCRQHLMRQKMTNQPKNDDVLHFMEKIQQGKDFEEKEFKGFGEAFDVPFPIESRLGKAVGRLFKFILMYSRKGLASLELNNLEDFVYLGTILEKGTPKKSEIIQENLSEFSSGIEVLKRLTNVGFLYEFQDEQDRRSRRVGITPKGIEVLHACFPIMRQVGNLAFGNLMEDEKEIALQILDKMDRFHTHHYEHTKQKEFDEIASVLRKH